MFNDKRPLYFLIALSVLIILSPIFYSLYESTISNKTIIYALFISPLIIGLIRLNLWAIYTISSIILVLCIFVPIGVINPHAAMDMANPPPVFDIAIKVYSFVAIGVVYVYVLHKFEHLFHKRAF